ncbi:flagellar biosynthesis regulator FlaF [Parvularcula sp. ZS-1/3]|uniref:Flagellar biosynthesis regulator FlaF n=1 Tax=Parvularcula mediterranea TaxID=2732508 RepID=A0A7Y3RKK6_9PROT|nr:flagellar biosynthesis regulator FlaF [Parvularcula mediterranea]NNU15375.1 flagellar biosynthesis regulator FlaF [Parvularcula mediterranea]
MTQAMRYQTVQRETVSERGLEAALLERVTARLKAHRDEEALSHGPLLEALHANRSLWMTLAIDLASPDNRQTKEVKASMISIAGFIERNTHAAAKSMDVLDSFVDINEAILSGLRQEAPVPALAE